jgi:hypothetical protein
MPKPAEEAVNERFGSKTKKTRFLAKVRPRNRRETRLREAAGGQKTTVSCWGEHPRVRLSVASPHRICRACRRSDLRQQSPLLTAAMDRPPMQKLMDKPFPQVQSQIHEN